MCRNFGVKRTTLIETLTRAGWPASVPLWRAQRYGGRRRQYGRSVGIGASRTRTGDDQNRANRLGFAILLTFFRDRGRFPRDETEVEVQGIAALAKQLDAPAPLDGEAFLTGRTAERLRGEIRVRFGFREATVPMPRC